MKQLHKDMLTSSALSFGITRAVLMATTPAALGLVIGGAVGLGYTAYTKKRDLANSLKKDKEALDNFADYLANENAQLFETARKYQEEIKRLDAELIEARLGK
jgi:hypothetical protein